MVQVMRGNHFVFEARVEQLHHILRVCALKHKQVLYHELLLFSPANTQTLLVC